ncbi:MAG: hypothetical protein Q9160_005638 [Pyrenula sp. 1 TL-2023]
MAAKGKKTVASDQVAATTSTQKLMVTSSGARSSVKAQKYSFFDFPGEIRNKIYDHVFDERRVVVHKAHGPKSKKARVDDNKPVGGGRKSPESQGDSHGAIVTKPSKPYTGLYLEKSINGGKVFRSGNKEKHVNVDILFTCRKAYEEGICYLYANTTFWFGSFKPIRRLLRHCRPEALASIRHLQLYHVIYGEPALTVDREWKMRDDDRWMDVCIDMSKQLTGLQTLRLDLRICDWPTQLNLEASWALPILELGKRKFFDVKVKLIHPCFSDRRLKNAANVLEEAIMCDAAVEKRKEARALRAVEEQLRRERESEQQKALAKMPIAERIQWEAMMAEDEAPETQQAVSAPKILKINIPENSPHWKQQAAQSASNIDQHTQVQDAAAAGPSNPGAKNTKRGGARNTIAKGQVHEGGYHGYRPRKEPPNIPGKYFLEVAKWDKSLGRYVEDYVEVPKKNW